MWILCAGPGGNTKTPASPELLAGIWMSSIGRNTEVKRLGSHVPSPPPPHGTCEFFFTFRIPRLEDTLHKPMCLILVSFLPAMTRPMCKKLD